MDLRESSLGCFEIMVQQENFLTMEKVQPGKFFGFDMALQFGEHIFLLVVFCHGVTSCK